MDGVLGERGQGGEKGMRRDAPLLGETDEGSVVYTEALVAGAGDEVDESVEDESYIYMFMSQRSGLKGDSCGTRLTSRFQGQVRFNQAGSALGQRMTERADPRPEPLRKSSEPNLDRTDPQSLRPVRSQPNPQLVKHHQNQISPFGSTSANAPDSSLSFASPDVFDAAKQMPALNGDGVARRASHTQGISGTFLGGLPSNPHHPAQPTEDHNIAISKLQERNPTPSGPSPALSSDPSLPQRQGIMVPPVSQQNYSVHKQRQQNFLIELASIMSTRNMPLPPSITGVQSTFEQISSHWNNVEPAEEIGGFKLAGKEVYLFKLWALVFQFGGSAKLQEAA
ncbi:hypothetical protein BD410DRAFT_843612 [Rickenella mellea]|uniref:Uncharacterized protein n=1 Tax=Rickenella mellea TaxID=50990 RepID=A0A4Y7PRI3_9AGAM|nr:hypothetical protein BD410DRAFT_843612 [Rickenella mellea]